MKKEKLEDSLYPDDHAELLRRIEEGKDPNAWSEGVYELFDEIAIELGGKKAIMPSSM
jgi:hypothetical protein